MKLIVHASLFVSGSVEVDMETGRARLLAPPAIKDDQALMNPGSPGDATRAGLRALAELHRALTDTIVSKVAARPQAQPSPLVNMAGEGNA